MLQIIAAERENNNSQRAVRIEARQEVPAAIHPGTVRPAELCILPRIVDHCGATIETLGHNEIFATKKLLKPCRPAIGIRQSSFTYVGLAVRVAISKAQDVARRRLTRRYALLLARRHAMAQYGILGDDTKQLPRL